MIGEFNPTEITMIGEFNQPWPGVLNNIRDWIRHQAALAHRLQQPKVGLSLSRALLVEAKNQGKNLHPDFERFCREILMDLGINVGPEDIELHNAGPHQVSFSYLR